jgi:hypothetical protein
MGYTNGIEKTTCFIRIMSAKLSLLLFVFSIVLIPACSKKDETLPEITIKGSPLIVVTLNTAYSDAGATATDNVDGILTVTASGTVDTNFAGNYYITYHAIDAAGNEAEAIRTVVVQNEAGVYNGNYNTMAILGIDTTYYPATSTISTILNNRIWLVGFSDYSLAAVYADIHHDTIDIPHQMVTAGSPFLIHAMSGNGFIKTISNHTVFEINFRDSVSGNIYNGISVYTKIN